MAKKPLHHHLLRGLKLALIPHAHNDYRPHLIRRYGLAIVLLLVIGVQAVYFGLQDGRILGENSNIAAVQLLNHTNNERSKNALPTLSLNSELALAARAKADNMLSVGYWSHNSPDGTTPWVYIEQAGYKYSYAGENLARGFSTVDGVINTWMSSPSHRANILSQQFTNVGFAVVNGEMDGQNTTLVVAMYGRPLGSAGSGEIAGIQTQASQTQTEISLWTRLQRGFMSLAPSLLVTLVILGITTCVAILAHTYRNQLPAKLRKSWYRHHALYKIALMAIIATSAVLSYGGGMI